LIKILNLSRISEYDRRCLQALAHKIGEKIRRRTITEVGHVSIKFYIKAKDRTINKECLVPVVFTVNMMGRTTKMALDESRLSGKRID
jgi:hypothetical protein